MSARNPLKLGTRRSALAWAQSLWVARQLESLHPGLKIELVPIETRGDRITNVPLSAMEGKGFFTAEIDAALLDKRVDLSVHSLKDLSLEMSPGLSLAAIPPRENPRDVILFRGDALRRLAEGRTLRIGTSAPRRLENVGRVLDGLLPRTPRPGDAPRTRFVEIRGNVDTRLSRLHEPDDSDRQLEGVVLALAGLIRLWNDVRAEGGRARLKELLKGLRWMVLPLAECPSAPGQGALAVTCRSDDTEVLRLLQALNDEQTARQVEREREILAQSGGGCHQRFGVTCITHATCGDVLYAKGKDMHGRPLALTRWFSLPPPPSGKVVAWDGLRAREASDRQHLLDDMIEAALVGSTAPVFVAHSRALPDGAESALAGRRVWTSGIPSWRRLAARGIWVEGCADSLGFDWIVPTLSEPVLDLPPVENWQVLTHAAAVETWDAGEVLATYTLPEELERRIENAAEVTHAYWASGSQFQRFAPQLSPSVHHACGPGKTAELIRAAGVTNLTVFPSANLWRRWTGLQTDGESV